MDQRLIDRVDRSGGPEACWPWTGCHNGYGYGVLSVNNRMKGAHRLAYEAAKGPIPKGLSVCHTCDNPPCCNPAHLFVGSHKDNGLDMARKERGARNKLTGEQAKAIRADPRTTKEIAPDYGVHWSNIAAIKAGRTWVHLDGATPRGPKAKITEDQVRAIRKDTRAAAKIAAELDISPSQVDRIRWRKRWAHVED
jgi:hypothetical protein